MYEQTPRSNRCAFERSNRCAFEGHDRAARALLAPRLNAHARRDSGHARRVSNLEIPRVQLLKPVVLSCFLPSENEVRYDFSRPQMARVLIDVTQELMVPNLLAHDLRIPWAKISRGFQ